MLTVASMAAFPLFPLLRQVPVVLIAINPNAVLLAWSAPRLALPVFVAVATVRLCLADPWNYALGLRYGCAARDRVENTRWGPWLVRVVGVERVACAIAVFVRPSRTPLAWAGSLRMSPRVVAALDVAGTVVYVVLLHRGMSLLS